MTDSVGADDQTENKGEDVQEQAGPIEQTYVMELPPLWRNRDYMLLWSGQVVSVLGGGISGIAFPLLILALTKSPAAAGFAGALGRVPYLLFSLPVGALIDRWDRKRVMILCDLGRAISLASVPVALYFDALTIWQLYINAFLEGTLYVFFNIAEVAALTRVVNKAQLPQASAQNEAGFIAADLVGAPLGGFLYQSISRLFPFIFDSISYIISAISLLFIQTTFQEERAKAERHLGREVREGLSWLWRHPLIRFMAFLTGGNNFVFSGSGLILIVLAQQVMGASPTEIGTMFSIGAAGGILGSLVGGRIQKRFRFGQVIVSVMWAQALLFPLYAFAPNIFVLGAISALLFASGPIYNIVQFSYRLALIPDKLQGRVNSTFRLLAFGFQPIGSALAGVLLEQIGIFPTLWVFAGVLVLLTVLATLNSYVRNARPIEQVQAV